MTLVQVELAAGELDQSWLDRNSERQNDKFTERHRVSSCEIRCAELAVASQKLWFMS